MGEATQVMTASVGVRAIAVADLDRNGRPDLVLADGAQVRIAASAGVTATAWSLSNTIGSMDSSIVDLAAADLNRDGRPDLAVAASDTTSNSHLVLWQGPGSGANPFTATWSVSNTLISSGAITLSTLAVGDLNGDGAPDLVAAGGDGRIRMWRNPMTKTQPFTTVWGSPNILNAGQDAINQVLLADFDRDGRSDIVAVSGGVTPTVRLWQNPLTTTASFTTAWSVSNTLGTFTDTVHSVVVADLDGNGTPDVCVGRAAGAVVAWSNPLTGALPFTTSWGSPASLGSGDGAVVALTSADFDNDGSPDLVGGVEMSSSVVLVWRNPGTPFGSVWPMVTVGIRVDFVYDLAVADLEPDADIEIVSANGDDNSGVVLLWPNTRTHRDAAFENAGVAVGPMSSARAMLIGDLNRDGRLDIVANQGGGYMRAWENDGTPFDGTWPQHNLGWSTNSLPCALADLDGDGDLDIVAANWCEPPSPHLEVWRNDGDPFSGQWATRPSIGSLPAFVTAVAVGDLDRNGTLEIVAGVGGNGSVSPTIGIWHFEGDPFSATPWISSEVAVVSYTVNSIALGDLNNDGWLDIVFGTNHAPPAEPMPEVYQLRAAPNEGAPFDGGWTLFDLGRDPQWTGLEPYHGYRGETIHSVALADFDNDGYLDIVTGERVQGDHQIMVWKNDGVPFDGELWQPTTVGLGPHWEENGNPWLADAVFSVVPADFNDDGLVDLVSGSGPDEDLEVSYWENSGVPFGALVTDTHWIRHGVGAVEMHVKSVGAADFDGDGDIGVVSMAEDWSSVEVVHVWQNRGGVVGQVVSDTAPAEALGGTAHDLMRVVVSHHGKSDDHDIELAEWRLTLEDETGAPLTSAQASVLISDVVIYRDANDDSVWQLEDAAVVTVSNLSLASGVQTFSFTPGDPLAAISATGTVTYFVVATLRPNANHQTPSAFRVTFDPDAASVVKDRASAASVSVNDTLPVTAGPVQAIAGPVANVGVAANPPHVPGDGTSTSAVTARVEDAHGNSVVNGTVVTFATTLGTFLSAPYTATTLSGQATAMLTAPVSLGVALITATADGQFATTAVTFTAGALHHIVVSPTTAVLTPTATQRFTATGYDQHSHAIGGLSFTWEVVNGGGTIDSRGVFTAGLTVGTYTDTVRATAGGISGTATVTVAAGELHRVVVDPPSVTLMPGGSWLFAATGSDRHGNVIGGLSFAWEVVNGGGTIDSRGVFTAGTTPGTYTDTVRATAGGISGTATVTVAAGELDRVVVDPPSVTLAPEGEQLFAAAGYDRYGNVINGLAFTWDVVNGGGIIDVGGLFTAGIVPGTYPETVQATAGGISGYASVTITAVEDNYLVFLPLVLMGR